MTMTRKEMLDFHYVQFRNLVLNLEKTQEAYNLRKAISDVGDMEEKIKQLEEKIQKLESEKDSKKYYNFTDLAERYRKTIPEIRESLENKEILENSFDVKNRAISVLTHKAQLEGYAKYYDVRVCHNNCGCPIYQILFSDKIFEILDRAYLVTSEKFRSTSDVAKNFHMSTLDMLSELEQTGFLSYDIDGVTEFRLSQKSIENGYGFYSYTLSKKGKVVGNEVCGHPKFHILWTQKGYDAICKELRK